MKYKVGDKVLFIKLIATYCSLLQPISEGRHVNIQMRALKAAWEAHKREVHQQ